MSDKRLHGNTTLVNEIETYISSYVTFANDSYLLPIVLWIIGTHLFESFDAFPYLCISSSTKQSGKTRLAELTSFVCNNPFFTSGATAPSVFKRLDIDEKSRKAGVTAPTVFFDEAEEMSKGDAGAMRSFLNSGYRKGQVVPRVGRDYPSYCPKCFILIGDVYDTLRDRSIILQMQRAEPKNRFLWSPVQEAGNVLREKIIAALDLLREQIEIEYAGFTGLPFLTDRDEEIWAPLFSVAAVFCPDRFTELSRHAIDIATEKTAPRRRHVDLIGEEDRALQDQYSKRLLVDLAAVMGERPGVSTKDLLAELMELSLAPWRRFRGTGLTAHNMSDMLSRFGLKPKTFRVGRGRSGSNHNLVKGYRLADVRKAMSGAGL